MSSLRRWRVLDASESFRRFLSPNWDLPERLASYEKTPESATQIVAWLRDSHTAKSLTGVPSSDYAAHPEPITGCQAVALLMGRAWGLGDPSVLALFQQILAGVRRETAAWPAKPRAALEPIIGVTRKLYEGLEALEQEDPTRVTHQWAVASQLYAWASGERETAKEWARELDNAMASASRHADNAVCSNVDVLTEAAAQEMTTAGYAFALGLLCFDRDACVLAAYWMVRLLLGTQTARFLANKPAGYVAVSDEEMAPLAYHAASRPWVGALGRGWGEVFAASLESNASFGEMAAADPIRARALEHAALNAVKTGQVPHVTGLAYSDAGALDIGRSMVPARERGFLPHVHKIPPTAFDPEPTPQEKEEP